MNEIIYTKLDFFRVQKHLFHLIVSKKHGLTLRKYRRTHHQNLTNVLEKF